VAERKPPVKQALADHLASTGVEAVGLPEWEAILRRFPESTPGYLRRLLRDSGLPLAPLVEGVRQDSLDELERTLRALEVEYAAAGRAGQQSCRRLVIDAKDHARLALRRLAPGRAAERREMIEWMIVWLENPSAFPTWVHLRRRSLVKLAAQADRIRD
jgi:hypothetical protein